MLNNYSKGPYNFQKFLWGKMGILPDISDEMLHKNTFPTILYLSFPKQSELM